MQGVRVPILFLAAMAVAACDEKEDTPVRMTASPEEVRAAAQGINAFAFDLFAKLAGSEDNLFVSPYSLSAALAMTFAGAEGETEAQMRQVLRFTLPEEALHPAYGGLETEIERAEGAELSVANALWAQENEPFEQRFLGITRQFHGAGLQKVDFTKDAEAVRVRINAWVSRETRGKIEDLIAPGVLDALTRLVLTNAIYFKGTWQNTFDAKATHEAPFHRADGEIARTRLMTQKTRLPYYEREDLQVLKLPYKADAQSMIVYLPKEATGIAALQQRLGAVEAMDLADRLRPAEVKVFLPKFTLEKEYQLASVLAAMGMPDAFTDRADFSGINGKRNLAITAVVHKTFVDVNEEGTEAAGATGVVVGLTSVMEPREIVFRADRPFVFLIRDEGTGAILFLGRMMFPPGS